MKQLLTAEMIYNSEMRICIYAYNKEAETKFKLLGETSIPECFNAEYMDMTRDGSRVLVYIPEPNLCLKIFDISAEDGNDKKTFTEILTIKLSTNDYKKIKFDPINKNYIFLMSSRLSTLIQIIDSFDENFSYAKEHFYKDLNELKRSQEPLIRKRYESFELNGEEQVDDYIDFTWDNTDRVYVLYSGGQVKLIDPIKEKAEKRWDDSRRTEIKGIKKVSALLFTQKYLILASENKLILVNVDLSDEYIKSIKRDKSIKFSFSLNNYQSLEYDREISIMNFPNDEANQIVNMKYDDEYQRILIVTQRNEVFYISFKAESNLEIPNSSGQILKAEYDDIKDVNKFEEIVYHTGPIIGVRELGKTSIIITISSTDRKVIFWDIAVHSAVKYYMLNFTPTAFECDPDGGLLYCTSTGGVLRIFDISQFDQITNQKMRCVYQNKFHYKSTTSFDRIVPHPSFKFLVLYKVGDKFLYFISGEISKKFAFLGFINVPTKILDVYVNAKNDEKFDVLGSVIVLVKGMLLQYDITKFNYDNKSCWNIKNTRTVDVFSNFKLEVPPKARKVDGDLTYILKNKTKSYQTKIWLTGTDKMIRIFPIPQQDLKEVLSKNEPIEDPIEFKAHDLDITEGYLYPNELCITSGKDGFIQYRKGNNLVQKIRTHSFCDDGISCFFYSAINRLIYACGKDGSVVVLTIDQNGNLPISSTRLEASAKYAETLEGVAEEEDMESSNFVETVNTNHENAIKSSKKQSQSDLISRFTEIKNEQSKLYSENSKLETHEQLSEKDMIIDEEKINKEYQALEREVNQLIKKRFEQLCRKERQKEILFAETYNKMLIKTDELNENNNMKIISNSNGERILQTYPIPTETPEFQRKVKLVKQLRIQQKMEDYKLRDKKMALMINEKNISCQKELYIINRFTSTPTLKEEELIFNSQGEKANAIGKAGAEEKRTGVAKYKLQRDPYEELNKKGEGESGDLSGSGPNKQIYKDDQQMEYRTVINTENIADLEFKPLEKISSYSLLYSPFELYTNVRIRNQIILLQDVIHILKRGFNEEFLVYIKERNQLLEKFNSTKMQIESVKEYLPDVKIIDYKYPLNEHEDNAWIEKFDAKEITVPKYYSKEEKQQMEEERKKEEERLKALQGDTLQMRGLKHMINTEIKKKKNEIEKLEVPFEPWMKTKTKEEMTEEERTRFALYQKNQQEIREAKEKIRSQNLTKLNFCKSEIENNLIDLDLKFAKILRKKLHYDSLITEQEIYILALQYLLQKREINHKKCIKYTELYNKALEDKEKITKALMKNFNYSPEAENKVEQKKQETVYDPDAYWEPIKKVLANDFAELISKTNDNTNDKINILEILDSKEVRAMLNQLDPYFISDYVKTMTKKAYGSKEYREITSALMKEKHFSPQNVKALNQRYYFLYKKAQLENYAKYLFQNYHQIENRFKIIEKIKNETLAEKKKLELDMVLMIRMYKGMDEITDPSVFDKKYIVKELNESEMEENEISEEKKEDIEENEEEDIEEEPDINEELEEEDHIEEEKDDYDYNAEEAKMNIGLNVGISVLRATSCIEKQNKELREAYIDKLDKEKTKNIENQKTKIQELNNILLSLENNDYILKGKYLKLTRVTKRIQEIVTGKNEIDQAQIAKLYEDKKKNLNVTNQRRIENLDKKYKEIVNDTKKKKEENEKFSSKILKLQEDVKNTDDIIHLDEEAEGSKEGYDRYKKGENDIEKSSEIAEVSKLKNIVTNYYEEIEYLRAELDKLRARTFPSFLQKPDNSIYPDEK